jgi:hypothetical protein
MPSPVSHGKQTHDAPCFSSGVEHFTAMAAQSINPTFSGYRSPRQEQSELAALSVIFRTAPGGAGTDRAEERRGVVKREPSLAPLPDPPGPVIVADDGFTSQK